ncbi:MULTISPECIES: shikimate dehydrogenase [unclassified Dehalobacter]|uniref:shikimate dehydrogenase n=1 Tax=unclassified Dehalobacter TaxID=2635733 RepID=UPI000E6C0467|nr:MULTISPECIES: shikimate dehydrogenase [unclassified Dehalobacter]RJE48361.1 shikimate dehydrogenase [Dehalobacter sp. MCB1]TCX50430.1 shikimate dehydrogenase [Dehalobacter sp. 14DCB1]TCX52330.1 shikimate dehydrogenase [Dehalobacter sp. 12DCB1]
MKYAIIGYPVEHSLSPKMHEAGFKAAGLPATYDRITVQPIQLAESIGYLKNNHYDGWNVTYPLKEKIIPYMDVLTPEAQRIGAVNTVKVQNGRLYGHNTDGGGFIQALLSKGFIFEGKEVVILGAGGAAKAIAAALASLQVKMLILNRSEEKAGTLAGQVNRLGGNAASGNFARGCWLEVVDLLIQTTSIGMKDEAYTIDLQGLNPSAWAVDLIYHPAVTDFMAQAAACGCRSMNGLDMLLFQGILAWEFWLEQKAPLDIMRKALQEKLEGNKG